MENNLPPLLPCPFCGESYIYIIEHGGLYVVDCDSCECGMGYYDSKAEAIEAWNTRYERTTRIVQGTKGTPVGESLVYSLTCEACGCGVSARDSYCRSCGARIVKEDTDA